jgi:hypothetical protein
VSSSGRRHTPAPAASTSNASATVPGPGTAAATSPLRTAAACIPTQIFMWVVHPKCKKDDLGDKQTAILRDLVKAL